MLAGKELKKIEIELYKKGLPDDVRKSIRNAKICIIDDGIKYLKSITDDMKREGFNNLITNRKCPPVHTLLSEGYDLIMLDLNDVALELSADDGIGILKHIKESKPFQPVLVITGQNIPADKNHILNMADLVRKKPIKASDLASDVEQILRTTKDKYWASLSVLDELNRINVTLKSEIGFFRSLSLWWKRRRLEKSLQNYDDSVIKKMENILKVVSISASTAGKIIFIIKSFHSG